MILSAAQSCQLEDCRRAAGENKVRIGYKEATAYTTVDTPSLRHGVNLFKGYQWRHSCLPGKKCRLCTDDSQTSIVYYAQDAKLCLLEASLGFNRRIFKASVLLLGKHMFESVLYHSRRLVCVHVSILCVSRVSDVVSNLTSGQFCCSRVIYA